MAAADKLGLGYWWALGLSPLIVGLLGRGR
ncbi:protein of unknown function, partial [Azospirillum baldaniorum]